MKEIQAVIQPLMLERVINAFHQIKDLPAVTISTAHGVSVEGGAHDRVVKTKLEVMVPDEQIEQLVEAIQKAAGRGGYRWADQFHAPDVVHAADALQSVRAGRGSRQNNFLARTSVHNRTLNVGEDISTVSGDFRPVDAGCRNAGAISRLRVASRKT